MNITHINLFRLSGTWQKPPFTTESRQAQQLDIYPEFNAREAAPSSAPRAVSEIYVEIETDDGPFGLFGPIEEDQAWLIAHTLRPFLLGRDALANEALLDQMLRLNRHGRSGLLLKAISVIDCALWDLKGKAWRQPVYRLLGGPTRDKVPAYASMLGFSTEPENAAARAVEYKAKGFSVQKWFFRHGPGDGEAGLTRNLAMAQAVREAVGDEYTLMFDAFMGWDLAYATRMVQALEPLRPRWLEEPLPPERVSEFRRLRAASRVPIATGEHVYTRWQTKELLVHEAVDVLQNDPDWTGGITELVKIAALASSFGVPLVAHGHSLLPALHVAASQSPATVPLVEFLIIYQEQKQYFHTPIYRPADGNFALPDLPGLGIVLDEEKVEVRETLFGEAR